MITTVAMQWLKTAPDVVARATLDAVEAGQPEVLADDVSQQVRAALSGPLGSLDPSVAATSA